MDGDVDDSFLLFSASLSCCSSMAGISPRLSPILIVPWISRIARPEGVWRSDGRGLLGRMDVSLSLEEEEEKDGRRFGGFDGFGGWRGIDGMVVVFIQSFIRSLKAMSSAG